MTTIAPKDFENCHAKPEPIFIDKMNNAQKAWRALNFGDNVETREARKSTYPNKGFWSANDQKWFFARSGDVRNRLNPQEIEWSRDAFERFQKRFGFLKSFDDVNTQKSRSSAGETLTWEEFKKAVNSRTFTATDCPNLAEMSGTDEATFMQLFSKAETPEIINYKVNYYNCLTSSEVIDQAIWKARFYELLHELFDGRPALDAYDLSATGRYGLAVGLFNNADGMRWNDDNTVYNSGLQDGVVTADEFAANVLSTRAQALDTPFEIEETPFDATSDPYEQQSDFTPVVEQNIIPKSQFSKPYRDQ